MHRGHIKQVEIKSEVDFNKVVQSKLLVIWWEMCLRFWPARSHFRAHLLLVQH